MLNNAFSIDGFLCKESGGGEHGKTSVLKFLGGHDLEFLLVLRLEAERVESEVTGCVFSPHETGLVDGDLTGRHEGSLGTSCLKTGNGNGKGEPERGRDLEEVGDGGSLDGGIPEEGCSLNLLTNEEAKDGEHGNTSVSDLGLTVSLHGGLIGLVGKSERIKESDRIKNSWKIKNIEGLGNSFSLLGSETESGEGGSSSKEGESGNDLHDVFVFFLFLFYFEFVSK